MTTWPTKKLGEVADYINGRAFKPVEWGGKGLPIIRIQNLTETQEKFNYFTGELEGKYLVKDGDILLSWSASLGVYVWDKGDAVLNQHIFKVVPHKDINKNYLFYALIIAVEELKRRVHGSTMTHVTKPVFNRVTTYVPPPEIQKQIVERMDKIAEAQKLNGELIQKADELFQSLLHKEFQHGKNWKAQKLENLLELCDAGVWGKATKGGGILVLRSTNFKNGGLLDFSNVPELKIDAKKSAKAKLMDSDILLEKSGGGPEQPVGRVVYFIAPDQRVYAFANFIQRLRSNSNLVNSSFLFYYLLRLHNVGYTKKLQSQTTGIRNLKLSLYLKTEILLPSLEIQKKIVKKLSAAQEYKKQLLVQKSKLKELFDSVLDKSMKGEMI